MKNYLKIFLIIIPIVIITVLLSIILVKKVKVFSVKNRVRESIIIGDNEEIKDLEPIEQKEINYDDTIGTLTIPNLLLENIPIKESTELSTLENAIGHFTNTSIYSGNVGLASHNGGDKGDFFRNLNKIKKGYEIYYQTNFGTRRYVVKTIKIIDEKDWSYLEETKDNRITLITCVLGQKDKRLCVQAVETDENLINN